MSKAVETRKRTLVVHWTQNWKRFGNLKGRGHCEKKRSSEGSGKERRPVQGTEKGVRQSRAVKATRMNHGECRETSNIRKKWEVLWGGSGKATKNTQISSLARGALRREKSYHRYRELGPYARGKHHAGAQNRRKQP